MARAGCSGSSTTSHTPASRTANAAKAKAATKSAMAASHTRLTPNIEVPFTAAHVGESALSLTTILPIA